MTKDQYSAIAEVTLSDLQSAKGFIAHYAFLEGDGLTVSEIWDTQADHDAFFDEHIKPKLPQEIPTPAVFEVLGATTARTMVGGAAHTARHAVEVLGGAAGGAWSWTRSKLGDLTHRSEKAEAGTAVEPAGTTTPASASAPPEAPPAKGAAAGEAAAKSTSAEAAPASTSAEAAPPQSTPSTGKAGGTFP
ncbi:hypothetical protein Rwratislav_00280 [Rhodococcus wratislaviensis IFP 2016]|uniref:ABM domain-containing protein n=1 Tax=Rhodococcus opacus M213 TaxID=1129896 RepID=K8XI72_RHOOP|nr:hypothetical protein [Rhodococcus opacus]EKT80481.1 hypothetical protein WSS_A22228 [Rhodococcus opacus M213]ELB95145.1 hypothetical protein Rwratislav_00280 [Rhodococcus wratislaviensis IFP 2016]